MDSFDLIEALIAAPETADVGALRHVRRLLLLATRAAPTAALAEISRTIDAFNADFELLVGAVAISGGHGSELTMLQDALRARLARLRVLSMLAPANRTDAASGSPGARCQSWETRCRTIRVSPSASMRTISNSGCPTWSISSTMSPIRGPSAGSPKASAATDSR